MSNRFQPDEPEREIYQDPDLADQDPPLRALAYCANNEAGRLVGEILVDMCPDGSTPSVVRDQHGTTWIAIKSRDRVIRFERVACAEAQFVVR